MCMSMPRAGLGTCDANGCGTFLRASKFPCENAIRDVTHHIEMREREFAVLDYSGRTARRRRCRATWPRKVEKLEDGFYSISGAAVDADGKLYFVDQAPAAHLWLVARGRPVVERDNPARSGEPGLRQIRQPAGAVVAGRGRHALQLQARLARDRDDGDRADAGARRIPDATALLPVNYWNNGEFKDQLDPETYRYTTLAEMFARDMAAPKATRICLARRQPVPARRPHLPAGPAGRHRLALLRQSGHLRLCDRQAGQPRLCQQRIGSAHL